MKWKNINIFLATFSIMLIISFSGCKIASTNSPDKASEATNYSITPAINETNNVITNTPSITISPVLVSILIYTQGSW